MLTPKSISCTAFPPSRPNRQFLDKTSLNYANLLGIKADMNLHGQQYSWLGSIFYFGYLGASPIHGYFLQK